MKKRSLSVVALGAAAVMALAACSGGGRGSDAATTSGSGFAAGSTIGVALPWLGTQNWKEAQDMFKSQLEAAGYKPLIQAADNKVPQQQQQIESMIEQGAKVIVAAPIDGTQLGSVLEKAKAAGVAVIGYDRLIENTTAVEPARFTSMTSPPEGVKRALESSQPVCASGPYNIELFGGGPADPNAPNFFKGAMTVLQPKIDDGTLVVVSGQKDFTQAATADWDNAKAQARMDSLLSGSYSGKKIDGVLSPNDGIARAILTSTKQAGGQDVPVVTGLDAENDSVSLVWQGTQWSTTYKPTDKLVAQTVEIIKSLQAGKGMPSTTVKTNNGKIDVPIYQLDPTVVTKDNAKEVFANDPIRLALLK